MMTEKTKHSAWMSLAGISLTVILAAVVHFHDYGFRALVAGLALLVIVCALVIIFRKTGSGIVLFIYGFLSSFIIIGFGLVNGFWNHAVKVALVYLHGGLPPLLARLFLRPQTGSFIFETAGILTFAAAMAAAYYSAKLIGNVFMEKKNELR